MLGLPLGPPDPAVTRHASRVHQYSPNGAAAALDSATNEEGLILGIDALAVAVRLGKMTRDELIAELLGFVERREARLLSWGFYDISFSPRELEVLATNKLNAPIDASPAIVGDQLYLRATNRLFCISGSTP